MPAVAAVPSNGDHLNLLMKSEGNHNHNLISQILIVLSRKRDENLLQNDGSAKMVVVFTIMKKMFSRWPFLDPLLGWPPFAFIGYL